MKLKGVENVYFIFLEREELMRWLAYQIYNIDVEKEIVYGKKNCINDNDGKYYNMFKDIPEHLSKENPVKLDEDEEHERI